MTGHGVVAVHVGAGCHSASLKTQYVKLMKNACRKASAILENRGSALDAVTLAVKILEDSPLTNAGYGSSLTIDGTVECDAGLMAGHSLRHGAVGAVAGVQNPILLAREILDAQESPLPGGLVPPSLLVGPGARDWAARHNVTVCPPSAMITERARQVHDQSLAYISAAGGGGSRTKRARMDQDPLQKQAAPLDTVGAVGVDRDGNVASAVSSGGLLLKQPGRVGQAALYACGTWAQNDLDGSGVNVAVSTSGCGEHLVRTRFALVCARAALSTDPLGAGLARELQGQFLDSVFLRDVESPMGGAVCLRHSPTSGTTDLFWLHTTRTMGVAYSVPGGPVQASFSELPRARVGRTVAVNCKSFSTSPCPGAPLEGEDLTPPSPSKEDLA